jgi:hypothetical protein
MYTISHDCLAPKTDESALVFLSVPILYLLQIRTQEIDEINSRPGLTWKAGINAYSDMTWEEFKSAYTMNVSLHPIRRVHFFSVF